MAISTERVLCICFFTLFVVYCQSQNSALLTSEDNPLPAPTSGNTPLPSPQPSEDTPLPSPQTSEDNPLPAPTSGNNPLPAPTSGNNPLPAPHTDVKPPISQYPGDKFPAPQNSGNNSTPQNSGNNPPPAPHNYVKPPISQNPGDKSPAPQNSGNNSSTSQNSGNNPPPAPQTERKPSPAPQSIGYHPPTSQNPGDKSPAPQNSGNNPPPAPQTERKPSPVPQSNGYNPPTSQNLGNNPPPAPQTERKPPPAPQSIEYHPPTSQNPGNKSPAPQSNEYHPPTSQNSGNNPPPAPHTDRKPSPATVPQKPAPATVPIPLSCDGACSFSPSPCPNAYCGRDGTSLTCKWITSLCVSIPVVNVTANCSTPGACGTTAPSCKDSNPVCQQTGSTCAFVCPATSNSGVQIDCTGGCQGTPFCALSEAQCALVPVAPTNTISSLVSAQCQWVCPDQCTSWCSTFTCPTGTYRVSCGPNPTASTSCLPVCASLECTTSANCLVSQCPGGTIGICKGPKLNCSVTCPAISCTNPCSPNCVPSCGVGSQPPCVNSLCTGSALSNCGWTPSLTSSGCISQQTKKCSGPPQCAVSSCQSYANGSTYWDNSACNIDCSSFSQSQCPGGYSQCTAGQGVCLLSGSNCLWTCPLDPCVNSSGNSLCPSPAPAGAPFPGCSSWTIQCLVSNTNSPVCSWNVKCTQVSQNTSGPCNASFDCGNKPNNTGCPGKESWSCTRPATYGTCQWVYACPPDPTLSSPCSNSDCASVNTVDSSTSSVCGLNPVANPVCVRNCKGICESLTPCYNVNPPPACQVSPCGDVCYDPRWLTGEIVPPDSFNSAQNFSTNCSLCVERCATLLSCNRPVSNPVCQFSQSNYYDNCVAKCSNTFVSPNNSYVPSYSGQDPCKCDYSVSTFVTAIYQSNVMYAACLLNNVASNVNSFPGVQIVYSSTSLPAYCQVSVSSPTTPVTTLINKVGNLQSEVLQQYILDQLSTETTGELANYIPHISAVLVASASGNSSKVKVGVILTLSGDTNPSQDTLNIWCMFVLSNMAQNIEVSSILLDCTVTLQSTSQKRSVGDSSYSGTYALTTNVDATPGTTTPGTITPGNGTATPGTTTPGTTTPGTTTPGTTTPGTTTPGTTTPGTTPPGTTPPSTHESHDSASWKLLWSSLLFTLLVLVVF